MPDVAHLHQLRLPAITDRAVREAARSFDELRAQHRAEQERLAKLREARHLADAADDRAAADAANAGKADPGPVNAQRADAELAEAERQVRVLALRLEDAWRELLATVERRRPNYREAVEKRVAEARKEYLATLEQLGRKHDEATAPLAELAWLADPQRTVVKPPAWLSRVEGLSAPSGDAPSFDAVLAALRASAEPPAPRPTGEPLTVVPRAA